MGVVHKLKPEVLNFILENKQNNPALSCRNLTQLILEKFQIKVSKSSINAIFKENNLSMPIGRRQKQKRKKFNLPVLPVIEGNKAITVIKEPALEVIAEPVIAKPPEAAEAIPEAKEQVAEEPKKEEISPEEKRIKEAEEWAMKLHEEERIRIEEKLRFEEQRAGNEDAKKKAEETEVRALLEEAARVKIKEEERQSQQEEAAKAEEERKRLEEKAAQEAKLKAEQERLAKLAEEEVRAAAERKRLEEEARKVEEEMIAQEAALKAEKEKWARLAAEEHKAKQQPAGGVILPKEELVTATSLSGDRGCSGAILLKALDYLIGGSKEINEVICKEMGVLPEGALSLTEAVIFRSLSAKDNLSPLGNLTGQQYPAEKLDTYYAQIKQLDSIKPDILKIITGIFTEARGLKLHFIDGSVVHLDAQLHSSWPTQYIPYDFCSTVYELKNNLNKYFFQGQPLILFSAPGYDVAPKDFFNLLLNFGSTDKYPDTLIIFGNELEEIEKVSLNIKNNYALVFGLWPWQFTSARKVKKIGDFGLKHIQGVDKDFYLADIEIDLLRASTNQSISLKGCAIKTTPSEKIRLVVLNSSKEPMGIDELAGIYLDRWPNLDEAFHDFSRKIELFAYVSNAQKFFSKDSCGVDIGAPTLEFDGIFANYIKILDAYLRWHFLPGGYIEKDLTFMSKHFYKIPVQLTATPAIIRAQLQVEQGYEYPKDLEYLIRRFNERRINSSCGQRLYFENAFK